MALVLIELKYDHFVDNHPINCRRLLPMSYAALCPLVFGQKTFDITKYAGVWYEAYRHDINEVDTKCENGTYVAGLNGTMNVTSRGFNQRTGYYVHQGIGKPRSTSEPASFLIHYEHPASTVKYEIIQTDYEQYSLIYSCDYVPIIGVRFEHIWFLSRNKTLPQSIVEQLKTVLKHKNIETNDIQVTSQDC